MGVCFAAFIDRLGNIKVVLFHDEASMTITDARSKRLSRREAISLLGVGAGLGFGTILGEDSGSAQTQAGWLTARSTPPKFLKDSIIRTVLKDVPPEAWGSGATMFHEHLIGSYVTPSAPSVPYGSKPPAPEPGAKPAPPVETSIELMVEELRQSAKDGVRCIVDASTAKGSARAEKDVEFLKQLATRVPDVHVILAGGPFIAPYAPDVIAKPAEQLTDEFVKHLTAQRWGAFGEIGSSMEMTADERKVLTALAKAQVRTGLPLFSHMDHQGCAKCALGAAGSIRIQRRQSEESCHRPPERHQARVGTAGSDRQGDRETRGLPRFRHGRARDAGVAQSRSRKSRADRRNAQCRL